MIGYQFFSQGEIYWRVYQKVIMPLSMPHVMEKLSASDARNILCENNAYLIRWEDEFDTKTESEWWHIIKDSPENIEKLSSNTRSKVRRGLRKFDCEPCRKEDIIKEGYEVYKSAFNRYKTHEPCFDKATFISALKGMPRETEFWSVRDKASGELVAFSENFVRDNTCLYNTIWFKPEGLRHYSSYALFFAMNTYYLNEKGLDYVSDGARSISHQTNIHEFLQSKFGFRKAYSCLHVVYTRWVYPFIVMLYPFRGIIKTMPGNLFRKLSIVLEQERIHKSCCDMAETN